VDKGTFAEEMNTTADDIEFGITRLPRGTFKATVHIFRGGGWWPPEAMRWINSRLALCGFEEAYRLGEAK
jgi:hypothetical protein